MVEDMMIFTARFMVEYIAFLGVFVDYEPQKLYRFCGFFY
jgi:hypothetical protein